MFVPLEGMNLEVDIVMFVKSCKYYWFSFKILFTFYNINYTCLIYNGLYILYINKYFIWVFNIVLRFEFH